MALNQAFRQKVVNNAAHLARAHAHVGCVVIQINGTVAARARRLRAADYQRHHAVSARSGAAHETPKAPHRLTGERPVLGQPAPHAEVPAIPRRLAVRIDRYSERAHRSPRIDCELACPMSPFPATQKKSQIYVGPAGETVAK